MVVDDGGKAGILVGRLVRTHRGRGCVLFAQKQKRGVESQNPGLLVWRGVLDSQELVSQCVSLEAMSANPIGLRHSLGRITDHENVTVVR